MNLSNFNNNYNQLLEILNSIDNSNNYDSYKYKLKWLEDYRKTNNAWYMSIEILKSNEENLNLKLFSSQTLRQKIIYELQDLNQNAIELKNSIIDLLYTNRDKPNPIIIQLCLSLADLAILCDEWNNPIQEVFELFERDSDMISILFQFLAYIPEELNNKQLKLGDERLKMKEKALINNILNNILGLLSYYTSKSYNNTKLKSNINNCIYNWIKYKLIGPNYILDSPLINYILSELVNSDVDEVIGNIINELIIQSSSSSDINKKLLNFITPTIFEISKHIKEISSTDSLLIFNLLFETYSEYNIYTIIENYNNFQFIISSLIDFYTIYPDSIEITYRFWTMLQEQLNNIGYQQYKPQFLEAYNILQEKTLNLYKLISNNNTDDISYEIIEIMLQNCFLMLNDYNFLTMLNESLKNNLTLKNEQGEFKSETLKDIEVQLFYFNSIIFNLNSNHQNIVKEIIKLIPYLPNSDNIKIIVIKIIGDLSEYSFNNKIKIEEQLNFLISFIENEDNRYQGLYSLLKFTEYCGMYLIAYLEDFYNFYMKAINIFNYQDIYDLIKSLCNIIIHLPRDKINYYLNKLNFPLIEKLQQISNIDYINNPNNNIDIIAYDIQDILSYMSLFLSMKLEQNNSINEFNPIIELYNNYHPILKHILEVFQNDEKIIEEICNCYIDIMNSCSFDIFPTIKNLLEQIVINYKYTKYNCYIWLFTHSIRLYMNESKDEIYNFLLSIFQKFTEVIFLLNENDIMKNIQTLEDYFHLCNQIIIESPSYIFHEHSLIPQILELSSKSLYLNDLKVNYEIIEFYSEIFNNYNVNVLSGYINYQAIKNVIKTILNIYIKNIEDFLSTDIAQEFASLLEQIYENSNEDLLDFIKEELLNYPDLTKEETDNILTTFTNACRNKDKYEVSVVFEKLNYLLNKKNIL
ncbi:ARM repeat-containing protein [Piromyces finnis]|uniref:ARM repeat-containing protein n=1 Tax=Piromyces finnis TaxID=1754191 RepID=A0A1Y1VBY4_9FUNG|nr:ARM repeat-containing protein [Piromyces finnis]|eukprot:ORX51410.1 ARM repeat-containing protein [Piromyces finnis]